MRVLRGNFILSVLCSVILWAQVAKAAGLDLSSYVGQDGVVYAGDNLINKIFQGQRDYTVALLLTAEGSILDCPFCRILGPEFRVVAKSWNSKSQDSDNKLYFVIADMEESRQTFETLGLASVPNLALYPPVASAAQGNRGLNARHEFIGFNSANNQRDHLIKVLGNHGFEIKIVKPFPWDKLFKLVATVAATLLGGYIFRDTLKKVLVAKQIWLSLCLVAVILFTGGHMFNVTRKTPMMGHDGRGGVMLFEPSFQSQYAVETQIVAVIYALLSFATIGLLSRIPRLTSSKAQTVGALAAVAIIVGIYSVLLETFTIKFYGYPYHLLPIKLF